MLAKTYVLALFKDSPAISKADISYSSYLLELIVIFYYVGVFTKIVF